MNEAIKAIAAGLTGGLVAGLIMSIMFLFLVNASWASVMSELHSLNISCSEEFEPGTTAIHFGETDWFCKLEKMEHRPVDENTFQISNSQQEPASGG